jgi:hypothetical protein
MTAAQAKLALAGGLALLAWWLSSRDKRGRVTSTLDIDANVLSPTFGEPLTETVTYDPNHQRLLDLVDESNRAIAEYDRTHPEVP